MFAQDGLANSSAIGDWSKAFAELHRRIGHRFCRSEARERVRRYLVGLLGRVERKNGWQMAEAIGEPDPQGVQHLLNSAKWDADAVRDDLREYVLKYLGDEGTGLLIVDETGLLKKGTKSVGVARQYTGTAGDTVNCQVGVFLAYSSEKGAAFLDRALYLPRAWDARPRKKNGGRRPRGTPVPQQDRACRGDAAANVRGRRARPVGGVADSFYGRSHAFRAWLEERGFYQAYGPPETTVAELVGVCQERLAVEECFAEAKGEVGLDHYEVRRRDAWYVT